MRYVGQEHAVSVELPIELFRNQDRAGIKKRFDAVHETRYGLFERRRKGRDRQPALRDHRFDAQARAFEAMGKGGPSPDAAAFRGNRPVYFSGIGSVETATYDRPAC